MKDLAETDLEGSPSEQGIITDAVRKPKKGQFDQVKTMHPKKMTPQSIRATSRRKQE